jgi:hypothetical protein
VLDAAKEWVIPPVEACGAPLATRAEQEPAYPAIGHFYRDERRLDVVSVTREFHRVEQMTLPENLLD